MGITPQRTYEIDDRRVNIYDDLFPPESVQNFANIVMKLNYKRRDSFDRELSVPIDNEKFRGAPFLWPVTRELFDTTGQSEFGVSDPSVDLSHVYAAAMGPESRGTVHQDNGSADSVTFLYYANAAWRGSWSGETVFYDQNLDAVAAITPRPGRLAMFHSAIYHRAGVPHPDTPTFRYTVSVFYYPYRETLPVEVSSEKA